MRGLDNSLDTGVLTWDSVGDWAQTSVCQLPSRIVANLGFTSHQSAKTISIVAIAFHLAAALPFLSDQTDTNCTIDDHTAASYSNKNKLQILESGLSSK